MTQRDLDDAVRRITHTRVNRRGFMAGMSMAGVGAFLAACSGTNTASSAPSAAQPTAAGSAAPSVGGSAAPVQTEGALYMYNWADYIEELLTRLQGGATGLYDVAAPTAEFIPAMVEGGFLQKIDWAKVPNGSLINPQFKKLWWDPNDEYQLPRDWGTTGIA
ncbi:MAG: hypothetical protein ACTS8Z_01125, partial [Candidatus Limnocylindrales bacterium]